MSFWLSPTLALRLVDDLRANPLQDQEVRRIVGAGQHYLTASTTDLMEHGLTAMFSFTVDDTGYVFAAALGKPPAGATETQKVSGGKGDAGTH